MEPIQDDIETIRTALLDADAGGEFAISDALDALDRLVAERDRLIQENTTLRKTAAKATKGLRRAMREPTSGIDMLDDSVPPVDRFRPELDG